MFYSKSKIILLTSKKIIEKIKNKIKNDVKKKKQIFFFG